MKKDRFARGVVGFLCGLFLASPLLSWAVGQIRPVDLSTATTNVWEFKGSSVKLATTNSPAASATAALVQVGAAPVAGSSNGQMLNINAPSGFTGNLMRAQLNGGAGVLTLDRFGGLILGNGTDTATIATILDGAAGQNRQFQWRSGGSNRWGMTVNSTAEGGSNAGSNFELYRYSDAGSILGTPWSIERATGNWGIETTGATANVNALSLGGETARTIGMMRRTGAGASGNNLTIQAGGGSSGGTDRSGGILVLQPGLSTGTGKTRVQIQAAGSATGTGTTDNTLNDRFTITGGKNVTNSSANSIFEIALPAGGMAGGEIAWAVRVSDGTDHQTLSGVTTWAVVNKAGTYTSTITSPAANEAKAVSAGTLTGAWSVLNGTNKVTLQFQPTSSLTPTTCQISYELFNNSPQVPTYL